MTNKKPTPEQLEWIQQQNLMDLLETLTETLTEAFGQTSDFTGWTLGESIDNLAFEMKRSNDLKEKELI